jgi:hypothetical protein
MSLGGCAVGEQKILACLVVDDFPLNAAHCRRAQVEAFGYKVVPGPWARRWRSHRKAAFMSVPILEQFADLVEEFDIRGKFTVLPCPAGWGRMDQAVRNLPEPDREALMEIVRSRIAPRFCITPEGLTHTLALDLDSGALLPHSETAWLTHLASSGRSEELCAYTRRAWEVLANVGLHAQGMTVGGMEDVSGIGDGHSLLRGEYREEYARAVLRVQREFTPEERVLLMYTGAPPVHPQSQATLAPEEIYSEPGGAVYELYSYGDDPLLEVFNGGADPNHEAEKQVAQSLQSGLLIEHIEAGRALVITVHSFTLDCRKTGRGLRVLREVLSRLNARYGRRISWMTPLELIAQAGVRRAAGEAVSK